MSSKKTSPFLISGLATSIAASLCCIGPFFLLATGFSAAWMSQLMALEPYSPIFIAATALFFAIAGMRIDWTTTTGEATSDCQIARSNLQLKKAYLSLTALAAVLVTSTWWIQLFA